MVTRVTWVTRGTWVTRVTWLTRVTVNSWENIGRAAKCQLSSRGY